MAVAENTENDAPEENLAVEAVEETVDRVTERVSIFSERVEGWVGSFAWVPESFAPFLTVAMLLAGLAIVSWLTFAVFRPLILAAVKRIVARSESGWDDHIFDHGIFRWLTHLLPALLIYLVTPALFESVPGLATVIRVVAALYLLLSAYFVIDSAINAARVILKKRTFAKQFNVSIAAQVLKLLSSLVFLILAISILIGKSPLVLLGSFGVLASVFMLVFKDVILGFVAGIQLSGNRMLSIGDWLEMPSHKADGDVEEIGLTTVKVRNFDKTITTIPTYALISNSFKNWRAMQESGGRRIKRSILIDTGSIALCTLEMLERFRQIEHIAGHLKAKQREIADFNKEHTGNGEMARVNGRRLTNIGTFRAYLSAYLSNHPDIHTDMTIIVRQLAPDAQGLPLEIYCFCKHTKWAVYEEVQADIFDHILAVASEFDLRVFQYPSGQDLQAALEIREPRK